MEKKVKGHSQYKKLRREGGSTVMAVTGFVPKDWTIVEVFGHPVNRPDGHDYILLTLKRVA